MRIIYFDIDTLRADHLGCYGYQHNTSPNIDKISELINILINKKVTTYTERFYSRCN